jgi:hypothetical protein
LQVQNNAMMKCMSQRKFYAPSDPKKDANGCVGVGDYDLNMASGSNVNLANGYMKGNNSAGEGLIVTGGPNSWAGDFSTNGYGILSYLNNGASTSNWTGEFYGGYGVYIGNTSNNAQLCLNGGCTMSLAHTVNVRSASVNAWRFPAAGVSCASNEIVTGGGGYCSSGLGFAFSIESVPNANGWYYACTDEKQENATAAVYAMCLVK